MAVAYPMLPPSSLAHSPPSAAEAVVGEDAGWLERFHGGDPRTMEACYRRHFATVERAVRDILGREDGETIIHEVFSRLIAGPDLRRSFRGGAFGAWIATVGRNLALDYRRRLGREVSHHAAPAGTDTAVAPSAFEDAAEARLLIERFRREQLRSEWQGVFELRFLQQLPQRDAASRLGINRTTLAYREVRIRRSLKRFLLEGPGPEAADDAEKEAT
jgi:RNA polymerase sigma-70 factor (ECF subfamily)